MDVLHPNDDTLSAQATASAQQESPRVAILCNSLPPYRIYLHDQLAAELPEVDFWTLTTHSNAYSRWSDTDLPASIRQVGFGSGEPTNEQTKMRYAWREWRKAGRVVRWLKENKVAAVLCQGCGDFGRLRVLKWCADNQVPCYLYGDFNIRADEPTGLLMWLKNQVYHRAVRWAYGSMPCGEYGRNILARYGGDEKPSIDYPFVPDVGLLASPPEKVMKSLHTKFPFLASKRRRILFSARFMPVKRPDVAIAAFEAIAKERPDWDLVMVGDGPLRKSVEADVSHDLKQRIHFAGFLNDSQELAGVYAQSDVLLLPSDYEPWGVVIVEAAAAGLAIISSDVVGAAPELVIDGRNGATFPRGNIGALADAMQTVTSPDSIDNMRRESRQVFDQWYKNSNPVEGVRQALSHCGVLSPSNVDQLSHESNPKTTDAAYRKATDELAPIGGTV